MTLEEVLRSAFKAAVGSWGIQPGEFWRMPIRDWWWLQAQKDDEGRVARGMMTRGELAELDEWYLANVDRYRKP